jgi:hypothetical protein
MKENRDIYFIAALADGEIKDAGEEKKLREKIDRDPELKFEFFIQTSVKNLVSDRLKISPAPAGVRKRLEKKISPGQHTGLLSKFLPEIFFNKPVIAWGSTIVLILAAALILLNRNPGTAFHNFALEQKGSTNMYVQAKNNFENILAGKLSPQFTSADPGKIKAFFAEQGVSYPTYIPEIKNWKLVGAVVSVDHGQKFAHHVYSTPDGKLVYLFQVNESEIKKHKFLSLTDDLISYLNSGHCYESTEGSFVTLLTKVKGNIFAVVSNGTPDEIENNLCQLN